MTSSQDLAIISLGQILVGPLMMASSCLHWSLHEEWRLHGWCWMWKHEGKKLKVFDLV